MTSPKRDSSGRFLPVNTKQAVKSKTPKVSKKPKTAQGTTYCALVVDASGSMQSLKDPTVKAVNANLQSIAQNAAKTGRNTRVSLYLFNSGVGLYNVYSNYDSKYLPTFTPNLFNPSHSTPLFDSARKTINALQDVAVANDKSTNFLVEVITDGEDTEGGAHRLNELVRTVQATDRWTLTFMLPKGYKSNFCSKFAVPEGNVTEWDTTSQGLADLTATLNASTGHFYQQTARGQFASKGFFTPDLSKLKSSAVKKELQDLSGSVRILKVEKEGQIRDFCMEKVKEYQIGNGFYQLTKPEKVAANKQIMLLDNTNNRVYGGQEARDLIGLHGDNKVRPGNMGNYSIFVQSTSTNRLLVRGSKLIYVKN